MVKFVCTLLLFTFGLACSDESTNDPSTPEAGGMPVPVDEWHVVVDTPKAALFAVNGTARDDVWVVGADDGTGPIVLHFNGDTWTQHNAGVRGDLWWVKAFEDGTVYMAGSDALVLRYRDGEFERLQSPGLGKVIIFGIWGSAPDDIYAVGSAGGRNGFVWHYNGSDWREIPLPDDVDLDDNNDLPTLTKVWGPSADDVWVVGGSGTVLRGNRKDGFKSVKSGTKTLLFTIHGNEATGRTVVVGGAGNGVGLEIEDAQAVDRSPNGAPALQGVWVDKDGTAWASGGRASLYRSVQPGTWDRVRHRLELDIQSLHAAWVDPDGGVWSVGGNVLSGALDAGVAIHNRPIEPITLDADDSKVMACPPDALEMNTEHSIARQWNEQLLNAIRRDTPRPTVHARNLFHLSGAIWDIWTAFRKPSASHYLVDEDTGESADDETIDIAISFAAYRLLTHRYRDAIGGPVTTACFDAFMESKGYDVGDVSVDGDSPEALGNRVGQAYIDSFADDGANESNDYADPDGYENEAPQLVVDLPGSRTDDPIAWQQLVLAEAVTQNGIPEGAGIRAYIGAHWGHVTPFSLKRAAEGEPYFDIGNAPTTLNDTLVAHTMDVIRRTAWLDVDDDTMWDISPGARGNNPLGTSDGMGYPENPATGSPYEPIMVKRSDFGRVLAEFWADGPDSETPPGHWNTIANLVADDPDHDRRLFGEGDELDRLAWDAHLYFALNGAVHDAAIAAWEQKRQYLTARPITLIRTLGALGQRTDPTGESYHEKGLPLEEGVVEVITTASSKAGERHAHLRRYVGEIALWSWRGEPGDRVKEFGGHGWIRAKDWMSYQRRTFVSPAFPGYASGHSAFSRAGAEVLTAMTGSAFFPGGSSELTFEPGFLVFESGPSTPVTLRWATYYDAADQAGASRIWGGIHVSPDDFDGRVIGSKVGQSALTLARQYFEGKVSSN